MSPRSEQLRLRLRETVVALCKEEAFYLKELRIEGTLCIVSDQASVLITQISEQIGDLVVKQEATDLPQLDPEQRKAQQQYHIGEKRRYDEAIPVDPGEQHNKRPHCEEDSQQIQEVQHGSEKSDDQFKSQQVRYNDRVHGGGCNDSVEKSLHLEQATLSQTFSENEHTTSISQLEESIQDFPEITKVQGKFQCPLCEKSYAFKHSAKAHLSTHNKNMRYECKMCPAKFAYASSLNGHIKKNHPDSMSKEYVCDVCQQICFNLPSLKQHYTWRHKDMKVPLLYEAEEQEQGRPAVFPGQMGISSSNTDGSRKDLGGGGDDTLDILQQVIQRYSTSSDTSPSVTQHHMSQPSVHQMYSPPGVPLLVPQHTAVPVLGRHYSTAPSTPNNTPATSQTTSAPKEKLNIAEYFDEVHVQTQHGVYRYQCKTCTNMFKSRHALYEHVNTHLGRKPFSCDICGLTFAHHSTLYNHKRNKHTFTSKAEKEALFKFSCPQCDKRFEFPSALDRHFAKYPDHSVKKEAIECSQTLVAEHHVAGTTVHDPASEGRHSTMLQEASINVHEPPVTLSVSQVDHLVRLPPIQTVTGRTMSQTMPHVHSLTPHPYEVTQTSSIGEDPSLPPSTLYAAQYRDNASATDRSTQLGGTQQ